MIVDVLGCDLETILGSLDKKSVTPMWYVLDTLDSMQKLVSDYEDDGLAPTLCYHDDSELCLSFGGMPAFGQVIFSPLWSVEPYSGVKMSELRVLFATMKAGKNLELVLPPVMAHTKDPKACLRLRQLCERLRTLYLKAKEK